MIQALPIFLMLADPEKGNFNAVEVNQEINAKEKRTKSKSKKVIAVLYALDLVILLKKITNYQGIVPFTGSGRAREITNTIL